MGLGYFQPSLPYFTSLPPWNWYGIGALGLFVAYLFYPRPHKGNYLFNNLKNKSHTLHQLTWQELEILCDYIYGKEWTVLKKGTGSGKGSKDGGIDLLLTKERHLKIVQVKHWRSKVGVKTVRELYGLMIHEKAHSVDLIAPMGVTKEAWQFVQGKPIRIIGKKKLLQWIDEQRSTL